MARHRNVRAMNIDEEYEGYYDCYGHSVEDDFCISPGTEAEFLYDRNAKKHSMSAFLNPNAEDVLHEEEESGEDSPHRSRTDSLNGHQPKLSSLDKAKLQSCIEGMQNVVGDTISEATLSKAALDHNFNMEKALNAVLSGYDPKPQRLRRERRKEFYFQTEYDFSMPTEYNFHDVFYEDSVLWCCSLSYVFDSNTVHFANKLKTAVQNSCTLFSSSSLLWMIMTPCKDPISMTFSSASSVQKNQNSHVFHNTSKALTVKTKTPRIVVNNFYDFGSHLPSSANAFKSTVRASKLHSFPCTSKYFSLKPSFLNEIALLHHYCRSLFRTSENLNKHIFDMRSLLGKNDSLGSVSLSNNVKQKSHIYLNLFFRLNKASVHLFSKTVNELIEILSKFCGSSSLNEYLLCFLSNLVVHFNKVCDESKSHDIFTFLKESADLLSQFQSSVYNYEFSELYQNCLIESLYSSYLSGKTKRKHACVKNNALIALQDINTVPPLNGRKCYPGKRTSKLVMNHPNKIWINEVKRFEKCIRNFFTDKIALFIENKNVCMCKKHKFKNHGFNCIESHRNNCIHSLSFITTIFICKQIICSLQIKNASSTSMHEAEFHHSNNFNMNKTKLPHKLQDSKCRNCGKVDFSLLSNLSKRYFEMKQLPSPKRFKIRNKNLHVNEIKNNFKHNVNVDHVSVPSNLHAEVAPLHSVSNTLSDSKSIHNISSKILHVHSHYIANNLKENSFNQCKNQNIKSSDCQQSMLNISNDNGSYEASNIKLPKTTLFLNEPSLISHINVISLENQDERNNLSNSSGSFMKSNNSEINDIFSELQRGSYVKEKSANNYEAVPSNVEHTVHLDFLNNDTLHKSTQSENEINDKEQFKDKCIGINNSKTSAESYNKTECQSFENEIQLQDLKRMESNLLTFALNDSCNKESKWASRMKNDDIVDEHLLNAFLDDQLISDNYDAINNSSTEPVLHPNSNNDSLLTDFESIYFGSDELNLPQLSLKKHKTYSFRDQGKECGESNDIISKYLLTSICNNGETDSKSTNNEISTSKESALSKILKHSSKCNELLCQEDGTSKNINNLLNDSNTDNCTENLIINCSVLQTNSKELSLNVGNSLPFNATEESNSLKDIINNFDVTLHSPESATHQLQQINEDMNINKFHFSSPTDMSLLNILDIDSGSNSLDSSCFLSNNQTDVSPKSLTFLAQKYFENSDVINSNKEGKMLDLNQNCTKELLKCEETTSNSEIKSRNESLSNNNRKKLLKEFSLADIYFSSQHKLHNDQFFKVENINSNSSMELLGFETMEINCHTVNGKQKQDVVIESKSDVYDDENQFAHVIDLTTARKVNQDEIEGFNIDFISKKSTVSDLSKNITNDHINTKSILVSDDVKGRNSLEKVQPSLFAKVLCSKFKPQQNLLLPKPPRSLKEILSSDRFCGKFSFNIPSPDDVAAEKQSKSFRTSGTTDKNEELTKPPAATDDAKDSPSFVQSGRLEFNTDETNIVDNLKKLSVSKESSPENKNILIEAESSQELSVNSSDINGIEDVGGKSSLNDTEQEKTVLKTDETNTVSGESTPKPKSRNTEKDLFEAYKKERAGEKPLINLVVIGHVDAGKSTLMGHLLFRLGCVAKRTMHKYEQDSKKLGKASFMYAWVLDETSEERTRGITMDVAQSKFDTPHRSVTLLDAPGHKDFIPNMITGAAQADVAVLVVDATRGEFETGFETGGQTREHTLLVRSLGVSQLAVAVNKLDNVNWDQDRYKEIVSKLSSFLKQAGFKENDVQFVPCSGLTGENLINAPQTPMLKSWYTGPCLVDAIDNFKPPERPVSKPFRLCIGDVFKGMGGGFCVSGRIEAGFVQNADRVLVMPAGEQAIVKGITIDEASVTHAFAGDHVTLQLAGVDINKVNSGSVVCDTNQPVKVTTRFQARLVIFNIDVPITKGFPVILHYQSMSEQAIVHKLISQLHRSTGQVVKKKPRCLTKNSSAVIEVEVIRPICVELYKDFKDLGRFMLRSGGSTIAAGLVTEIL